MNHANGSLKIRKPAAKDAPALSALLHELGFPVSPRLVAKRLKFMRSSALVAVRDGNVVGLLTTNIMPVLHRPTSVGRVSALIVSKKERRRGVGRALMAAAERELRRKGCALVEVTCNLRLKHAHAFYQRLGYESTSLRFKKSVRRNG